MKNTFLDKYNHDELLAVKKFLTTECLHSSEMMNLLNVITEDLRSLEGKTLTTNEKLSNNQKVIAIEVTEAARLLFLIIKQKKPNNLAQYIDVGNVYEIIKKAEKEFNQ